MFKQLFFISVVFTCILIQSCKKEKEPVACFTLDHHPTSIAVYPSNCSTDADHYKWEWGDGSSTTELDPYNHIYSTSGTYSVKLTAFSASGGKFDEITQSVTIN